MDVDSDFDQNLIQQFSCMGTTDKDDLVKQFQSLVDQQLSNNAASFFLEMNNWNLQAAIGSYFDINTPHKLPSMILMQSEEIKEGSCVPPNTKFVKTWTVQNNGDESWPNGCYLQFSGGVCMANFERLPVLPLHPGYSTELRLEMTSPALAGIYHSKWRMCTSAGACFGDVIWVILTVSDQCVNGLVQQFSHLSELGSLPDSEISPMNPFSMSSTSRTSQPFQEPVHMSPDGDGNMLC